MKNKLFIVTILMLLFQVAVTVNAQVKVSNVSPKRHEIEVREGNLAYILVDNVRYERQETRELKGKKYRNDPVYNFTPEYNKMVIIPLVRSVFSEERAKQLAELVLFCSFKYSPAENKILHFQFSIRGTNNEKCPLKLSELNELELKFRAEPKFIPIYRPGSGEIIEGYENIAIAAIRFNRLYE